MPAKTPTQRYYPTQQQLAGKSRNYFIIQINKSNNKCFCFCCCWCCCCFTSFIPWNAGGKCFNQTSVIPFHFVSLHLDAILPASPPSHCSLLPWLTGKLHKSAVGSKFWNNLQEVYLVIARWLTRQCGICEMCDMRYSYLYLASPGPGPSTTPISHLWSYLPGTHAHSTHRWHSSGQMYLPVGRSVGRLLLAASRYLIKII